MISVLCMGVWFIAVSNHMKKRGRVSGSFRGGVEWKVNGCAVVFELIIDCAMMRQYTLVLAMMDEDVDEWRGS
jgi:hypothetical protein